MNFDTFWFNENRYHNADLIYTYNVITDNTDKSIVYTNVGLIVNDLSEKYRGIYVIYYELGEIILERFMSFITKYKRVYFKKLANLSPISKTFFDINYKRILFNLISKKKFCCARQNKKIYSKEHLILYIYYKLGIVNNLRNSQFIFQNINQNLIDFRLSYFIKIK